MPAGDRSELYAALRSFFQKIAERGTVLMVFEDLHWADEGLLDFIEELVERATQSPIRFLRWPVPSCSRGGRIGGRADVELSSCISAVSMTT